MASVNKVLIIGNLGKDPETRFMSNGDAVTNITVATTDSWKDKEGNKQEKTEWHRVTFYRKLAEIVGEYLKKGSAVYIEGRLETRKWQDAQGVDRYSTDIIANDMKMLGSKQGNSEQSESFENNPSTANDRSKARSSNASGFDDLDSDLIPF